MDLLVFFKTNIKKSPLVAELQHMVELKEVEAQGI